MPPHCADAGFNAADSITQSIYIGVVRERVVAKPAYAGLAGVWGRAADARVGLTHYNHVHPLLVTHPQVKLAFVIVALALMDRLGRRDLLLGGTAIMAVSLGCLAAALMLHAPPMFTAGSLFIFMGAFEVSLFYSQEVVSR